MGSLSTVAEIEQLTVSERRILKAMVASEIRRGETALVYKENAVATAQQFLNDAVTDNEKTFAHMVLNQATFEQNLQLEALIALYARQELVNNSLFV